MEAFFVWLLQNLSWEALKKALPKTKHADLALFRRALSDAQNRIDELEQDRALLHRLVMQRNRALAELTDARRRIRELERDIVKLRKSKG